MKIRDSLYESVISKWPNGNIWLYSDPHFGDPDMPILRVNNISDEEQIKRINSKVGKNDTIIFLGDIGDIEYVKHIRGYKVLIMGNHDKGKSYYQRVRNEIKTFNSEEISLSDWACAKLGGEEALDALVEKHTKVRIEDNHLFDEVYPGFLTISKNIILSHEPIANELPYALNLYGHDHGGHYEVLNGNGVNLCAEYIDYTPVSLKTILESGILKNVLDIHRQAIDRQVDRKLSQESVKEG